MFLQSLRDNNQYPVLFIGSGITKRYYEDAPTWDGLLKLLWNELGESRSYEAKYHELERSGYSEFDIYTHLADYIEEKYDELFYDGHIELITLTPEIAHRSHQSPFRTRIAEIYSNLVLKESMREELRLFKSMLAKARMIITTNYDSFIEEQLNQAITVHVGNEGLFEVSDNICELYKIHGSIKKPNSIVITSTDYESVARTSVIINAKILSLLTESPILFLGYSLTDHNIQSLLTDLITNMPFDLDEKAKRIGVVKHISALKDIDEVMQGLNGDIVYTMLKTDNFQAIYKAIAAIDQGISPMEISKYIHLLRQIIVEHGKSGELDSVLTSIGDLDSLSTDTKRKNLVVALGDTKYLYRMPTYVDYIKSYFGYADSMPVEIALAYILKTPINSTLPIHKYKTETLRLDSIGVDKIAKRLSRYPNLEKLQETITIPLVSEMKLSEYTSNSISLVDMLSKDDRIRYKVKFAYAILHYCEFPDQVESLIQHILENEGTKVIEETNARKLFLAYSLHKGI